MYGNVLNIINYQENANLNHNDIFPHTYWDGYYQKNITIVGEGVEKTESLYTIGGNENWCSHYGKKYGVSLRN